MGGGAQLEFRVLGPLEALRDGAPVELPRPKQRALLAMLLLNAGQIVSTDRLIDAVWGREPPRTALPALQGLVADLRKALGEEAIVTRAPGYVLELGSGRLDLRPLRAARRGRGACPRRREPRSVGRRCCARRSSSGAARRSPTSPTTTSPSRRSRGSRSCASRRSRSASRPTSRWGDTRRSSASSRRFVAENPLRERPRGQLMVALYRSGRQAEALEAYQEGRRVLVEELGIDPSPQLQRLERSILNHDPSLELTGPARPSLPTGTITLLFTDIEGSTRLLHELGDAYRDLLTEHRRLFREAVTAHGGVEVDTQGDAHFVVFEGAGDAAAAATLAQQSFAAHAWPEGVELRVRMGMHTGAPSPVEWGYVGADLHRAARICSAAHGGQVLVSSETGRLLTERGVGVARPRRARAQGPAGARGARTARRGRLARRVSAAEDGHAATDRAPAGTGALDPRRAGRR